MRSTVLLVAVAVLAACGGDDDSSAEGTEPPSTSVVPSADLDAASEPVELPASFPTDVPVPADVELDNAEEHIGGSSTIYEVTGWFDGDPIRVARDYEAVLEGSRCRRTSRCSVSRTRARITWDSILGGRPPAAWSRSCGWCDGFVP